MHLSIFGTNSIRLFVARLYKDCSYEEMASLKEVVRLGDRGFEQDQMKPEAMEQAILVARRSVGLARSTGVEEFVAIATSATGKRKTGTIS